VQEKIAKNNLLFVWERALLLILFLMTKLNSTCANVLLGGRLNCKRGKSFEKGFLVEKVRVDLELGGMRNMAF
jgi:hypothetical protein